MNSFALNKTAAGLVNVDSAARLSQPVPSYQLAALNNREYAIEAVPPLGWWITHPEA